MNVMRQNIPLMDYNRGDQVTAAEVSALVLAVTKQLNNLTPANLKAITTGNFTGKDATEFLEIENFCGKMLGENCFGYYTYPIIKVNTEVESVLSRIMEV